MTIIANIFYNTPHLILYIIMCCIGVIIPLVGIHLVKIILPIELRLKDNVAIGYISANTSVLFAILAGFIIMYTLNNFNRAQEISRIEVNQLADICRDAPRLDNSVALQIQNEIKQYLEIVINQEWPAMQQGLPVSSIGEECLRKIRGTLINYKTKNTDQSLALIDIYGGLEELYNVRDERISMNESALGRDIWIVLIVSTIFTILVNLIYGMEHYLHLCLAPAVSIIAMSLLFIIFAMDRPFRGVFSIKPTEFQKALSSIPDENDFLFDIKK